MLVKFMGFMIHANELSWVGYLSLNIGVPGFFFGCTLSLQQVLISGKWQEAQAPCLYRYFSGFGKLPDINEILNGYGYG